LNWYILDCLFFRGIGVMAKALGRKGSRRIVHPPQPPKLKLFRPVSWYGGIMVEPIGEYVSHVMKELGRLGLEIHA
jgi:hypothetical protein